jgi:hypothetical protein
LPVAPESLQIHGRGTEEVDVARRRLHCR